MCYEFMGTFMFLQELIYDIQSSLHFQVSVMTDEQMAKNCI